jgi:hypothetical protein
VQSSVACSEQMAGSTSEIVRKMVLEIKAETEENQICADCKRVETRESMVEWVSVSRGVFICIDCAGIHRRPRDETPIVRSIRLDTWSMGHWEVKISLPLTHNRLGS